MLFQVVRSRAHAPFNNTLFTLRQDDWNDFSFQTQYQLYSRAADGSETLIGDVKILKKGQTSKDGHQLQEGLYQALDESYCSIGQSLDYYERLAGLELNARDAALQGFRDIVKFPDLADDFRNEPGWKISLFRSISEDDDFISLARTLLTRDYSELPSIDLEFSFLMTGWNDAVSFSFNAPQINNNWRFKPFTKLAFPPKTKDLPARISVIIGRNGSGKSTLLARLARISHASRRDRKMKTMTALGQLIPDGLGFSRIVAISYSAFDSFQVPGISRDERNQIAKDMAEGKGRYIFCGLRDIVQELADELKVVTPAFNPDQEMVSDRIHHTLLKPILTLPPCNASHSA
ncbi:MAG TPA: hypothetical protein VEX87_20440 [Skermanella sp.]|nr:hypothetical protein [Skermanella sp.]